MRQITTKYDGECRECGAELTKGTEVGYEKSMGIFCVPCIPTDTEDIRRHRQAKADRKADRYEEWAGKREAKAAQLQERREYYRGDIAFWTQPGHIPERARIFKQMEKSWEHSSKAEEMRAKAASLRTVAVKGDRERAREAQREETRRWIKKGMWVRCAMYGTGRVKRINKKTATIEKCGTSGDFTTTIDLSWLRPEPETTEAQR